MSRTYRKLPPRPHRSMGRCFKNRYNEMMAYDAISEFGFTPSNRMKKGMGKKSVPVCADDLQCSAWEQVHPSQWPDW